MQFLRSFVADERNLLGVCAALGSDFGFNPLYLRLVFAILLLWNPPVIVGAYVFTALVVALSHWLFPDRGGIQTSTDAVIA